LVLSLDEFVKNSFSIWNSEEGAEVMEQKQSITILKFL
jgi:hypothetical protein